MVESQFRQGAPHFVRTFEGIAKNSKFIRYLQARFYGASAVDEMRTANALQDMLQGLESLEITLIDCFLEKNS